MPVYETLIALSIVIIFSYLFDLLASKTRVPSVVMLLFFGAAIKVGVQALGIDTSFYEQKIDMILPLLGTLGLIFIVLEGALELEVNAQKKQLLLQSFLAALLIHLLTLAGIWALLVYAWHQPEYQALLSAVPLSVISSAVAIPSVAKLRAHEKEFVVYESSFSDIIGVTIFNFLITHPVLNAGAFGDLGMEMVYIIIISILATVLLGYLFEKLGAHKKFVLILAVLLLFYGIAKYFHLSALVLIFVFGLFAANHRFFLHRVLRLADIRLNTLESELHHFQSFTTEFAFVIRTFFFVIFGFSIQIQGLLHWEPLVLGMAITGIIYCIRFIYLKVTRNDRDDLLWFVAPRGLITILLFYSIPAEQRLPVLQQDVLLVVILSSIFLLAFGSVLTARKSR
jgi:NhaP-type Na+/H+ or K+/H+ antiporter